MGSTLTNAEHQGGTYQDLRTRKSSCNMYVRRTQFVQGCRDIIVLKLERLRAGHALSYSSIKSDLLQLEAMRRTVRAYLLVCRRVTL